MLLNPNATPTASEMSSTQVPTVRTRTCTIHPPEQYRQEMAFIAQAWDNIWDILDFEIQEALADPIAFAATSNPDTLYLHEAMSAPNRDKFLEAMECEVRDHEDCDHWELIPKANVPPDAVILPAVWSMKHKQWIQTNEIYKWKAPLNVYGGKQIKNVHYWETYSPVVKWSSV